MSVCCIVFFAVSCRAIRKPPWNSSKCGKTTWRKQYAEVGAPEQLHKGNVVRLGYFYVQGFFWGDKSDFLFCFPKPRKSEKNTAHFPLFCTVRSGKLFPPLPLQYYTSPWFFLAVAANRPSCACYCDTDRDKISKDHAAAQWHSTHQYYLTIWTLNPDISNVSLLFISSLGTLHFVCTNEVKRWCWLIFYRRIRWLVLRL